MNKLLLFCMSLFAYLGVYGEDSILVDRVWTERRTVFVNEAQQDSILADSVTEYNGICCGYRCVEFCFYSNHQLREISAVGDTLFGKWKLEGDLLTIRYDRKYRWHKRSYKYIMRYREKDYPTLFLFDRKGYDCWIFCDYNNVIRRELNSPVK